MSAASAGSRREMSPDRHSPRVSCASSTVRIRPGRPLMSRCCTGARRSGPQPPPRPRERTRSLSSFRSSSFLLSSSSWPHPARFQMLPPRLNSPPPSSASSPSNAAPARDSAASGAVHCAYRSRAISTAMRLLAGRAASCAARAARLSASMRLAATASIVACMAADMWPPPPRAARRSASSRASCAAVLPRLPLLSTSPASSSSSFSPATARWYLTVASSTLLSSASLTAGYFLAKRAAPSLENRRTIMVFSGSSGHLSSSALLPAVNASSPLATICCRAMSSGSRPRSRAARQACRPRADS
mmetsp:Transcript_24600/g.62492  ORF Transcript_24600/g.62492 Transcript_24600/m.62492 type:complete len:302 (-) Transcript_24600:405-1310(-)